VLTTLPPSYTMDYEDQTLHKLYNEFYVTISDPTKESSEYDFLVLEDYCKTIAYAYGRILNAMFLFFLLLFLHGSGPVLFLLFSSLYVLILRIVPLLIFLI
jgi:hypothetical protein